MAKAKATVHGAVSIVNAIANQKGATLGIDLKVEATVETSPGKGIVIQSENKTLSSRLINKTVEKIVSKKDLDQNKITITLESEIPTGYGLKSSSAISSAVALGCAKIFKSKFTDQQILLAGVDASIESKVSITGAYDDACSCYYGGFNVTDNAKKKRISYEKGPSNLIAVIFIPKNRKRGNLKKLKVLSSVFDHAWNLARKSNYWEAMIINGLATASILSSNPETITGLIERGALGASVSGNGPAIAAITKKENEANIKKAFSTLEGNIIVSKVSNKKAEVHEV
ncbi:Shikimate kinase protein [Marine Group I thaumarchaeote SCGC AAA799-E16]|uniref:Shikimate kinase n=5 Tax=Marine Group I TaxID=905826 RepID=A0A087S728_9ARCH|nr:Shikimate kinase protein [Marine Group I thaumarchaeote SCGC AAA799-E16]KFM16948.1 Shikimate kinase protein [Marine Group I thaumarchaeote SCGC AAA799-D11]KFM18639.1 Shikimate kinase protein [Marine Group I thaumarchaeote SCGC RSA3]KFM21532.1 Shikimate kinase protein [Marine Group I thaumarchaeote SCGC AAA799-B03]